MTDDTGENYEAAAPEATPEEIRSESEQTPSNEKEGLISALQAERTSRQQLQERLEVLEQQSRLKPREESYDPDDVVTYGDLQKVENKYKASLEEMRVAQKYPDYQEVISKYLPEILKEQPSFQDSLAATQNYEMAYFLAKSSPSYKKEREKREMSEDAKRIMDNSRQSGSLASTGAPTPVQTVKRYKDMSDDEFRQEMEKHGGF